MGANLVEADFFGDFAAEFDGAGLGRRIGTIRVVVEDDLHGEIIWERRGGRVGGVFGFEGEGEGEGGVGGPGRADEGRGGWGRVET